jgi:predicted aconitase with swiveling domain
LNRCVRCRTIVGGCGIGNALLTIEPINFLSMIDTEKGIIDDQHHELFGSIVKGTVLVFPGAIGSSVGAYAIYSMKVNGVAPAAIICSNKADITTASGCAISNIPLVDMLDTMSLLAIRSGMELKVDADSKIVSL